MAEDPREEGTTSDPVRFAVADADAGSRCDQLVRTHLFGMGRAKLKVLFEQGAVRRNGRVAKKGDSAEPGDVIEVSLVEIPGEAQPTEDLRLSVVLETADLVIVDKPAGVPCAATLTQTGGTLAGALLARYPEMRDVGYGPAEPGLVHRLDSQTSGLVLAARHATAHAYLRRELTEGRLTKEYLALCAAPQQDDFVIESAIAPHPGDARRVQVLPATHGRLRTTHCRVVQRRGPWALLRIRIGPGYRHQIRAHLASIGLPLLGDRVYGGPDVGLGQRHALHATHIAGTAPSGRCFAAESPLAPDLDALWDTFAEGAARRF